MTDYKEEQCNEIEALESIYPEELTVIDVEPYYCFKMTIESQYDGDAVENACCEVQFTYTAKYPDELPLMEICDSENISESECVELLDFMKLQAEENLGMVVIFTIYSAVQEKLTEMVENHATQKEEAAERVVRAAEEAENKRFEGTRVTIESFLAWKETFDAELENMKKRSGVAKRDSSKLTGKELFLTDRTLDDSDVKFLEQDGAAVQVDESLFQDMDDLDLGDEDLDLSS